MAGAAARSHLCAQRRGACTGGAGASAVVAPVGPRAAGRGDLAVKRARWTQGNRIELLENGEVFFPRVFDAIAAATREVVIETFILFDDQVGRRLQAVLIDAAQR